MRIYRYWHSRKENIRGVTVCFKAGSNESAEHAALLTEKKAGLYRRFADRSLPDPSPAELAELRGDIPSGAEYEAPVCEELVSELDKHNLVTRNRYGALVLNSEDHAFFDIDFDGCPRQGLLERLQIMLGRRPPRSSEERLLELLRRIINERFPYTPIRLYRTVKGFRLLMKAAHPANSASMREVMKLFHCDELYAVLCAKQNCFRARLTPKPRRIRMKTALKFTFPYDEPGGEERNAWLEEYERRSAGFAVCRLVKSFGPELKSPVTEYHDKLCGVGSEKPLA